MVVPGGRMKVCGEKKPDVDEGRGADTRVAKVSQPDSHHHDNLEGPGDDFDRERVEGSKKTSERSETYAREEMSFKRTRRSETMGDSRRKQQSSLDKQRKNAMMSSITPREEQSSSKAKNSFKTLDDERMTSLQAGELSSGFDHLGLIHSERFSHLARSRRRVRKRCSLRH